ncbi:hypothetical protein NIES932_13020 [Raphidiopsis curvata NIES-932]|nr:hypothetical protein NIES932_13020 [Raphidiopsis curvata NIES-932]
MKIQLRLSGKFERLPLNATQTTPISLNYLIQEVQAISTKYRRRTPELLRQSFGLDFIPESVLINLCKQSRGAMRTSDIYQVPPLKLLKPIDSQLNDRDIQEYAYNFVWEEGRISLTPEDTQIPVFSGAVCEQVGNYILTIKEPNYEGLNSEFIQLLWNASQDYWQNLPDVEKINYALKSHDLNNFFLNFDYRLSDNNVQQVKIWFAIEELPFTLRLAITSLGFNHNTEDYLSNLPPDVQLLVKEYVSTVQDSYQPIGLPDELHTNSSHASQISFVIDSGKTRRTIHQIIDQASEFLLISSYIIEDENLTELICRKSSNLPVYILTDLNNELLDRIDEQISDSMVIPESYQITDERKKSCLRMLLNQNIPIRSGAFHLKTYISEKAGYLGSCNLTRRSLDFNTEAGLLASNNSQHEHLITCFQHFWHNRSKDEVIPDDNSDGFRLRSVIYPRQRRYRENHDKFLTSAKYQQDLIENLRNFPKNEQIRIYSRSFQPSREIAVYLGSLNTRVFIDSSVSRRYENFYRNSYNVQNIRKLDNLHAKITILGNQVAYIGGINFNFNLDFVFNKSSNLVESNLHDLMYKTTDKTEINQIIHRLGTLNLL